MELDNCRCAAEEVGEVCVEGERGRKRNEAEIAGLGVEDPTGICVEDEGEGGELGHLLEGFCEEGVEGVWLLVVDGDGEGSDEGGGVRTCSEGGEDGEVVGGRGYGDVSVEGALCHCVEGVVCACDGEEIEGGEVAADGVQELWREGEGGHGVRIREERRRRERFYI